MRLTASRASLPCASPTTISLGRLASSVLTRGSKDGEVLTSAKIRTMGGSQIAFAATLALHPAWQRVSTWHVGGLNSVTHTGSWNDPEHPPVQRTSTPQAMPPGSSILHWPLHWPLHEDAHLPMQLGLPMVEV